MDLRERVRSLGALVRRRVSPRARVYHAMKMAFQNYAAGRPLSTGMQDPHFKGRFIDVPAIVRDWCGASRIEGADILDFGCGEGVSALGMAMAFSPKRVVGIDIMPDPERCLSVARANLGLETLPPSLKLYRVAPGVLHDTNDRFDVAYSWSVFEHVDQTLVDQSLVLIRSALRRDGLFLAQIAPLYYSAEGSHLFHVFKEPWIHLRVQQNLLEHQLRIAVSDPVEAQALWSTYITLNKITYQSLIARIASNGFEVVRTFTSKQDFAPPADLLDIYHHDALLTNQVVVLAKAV